jgi:hypothetical protein
MSVLSLNPRARRVFSLSARRVDATRLNLPPSALLPRSSPRNERLYPSSSPALPWSTTPGRHAAGLPGLVDGRRSTVRPALPWSTVRPGLVDGPGR